MGDILVIWRAGAIWFDKRRVLMLPLFWWVLMVGTSHYSASPDDHSHAYGSEYARARFALPVGRIDNQLRKVVQGYGRRSAGAVDRHEHVGHVPRAVEGMVSISSILAKLLPDSGYHRRLREVLMHVFQQRQTNKIFTLFVLMVESGMLYIVMLVSHDGPKHALPTAETAIAGHRSTRYIYRHRGQRVPRTNGRLHLGIRRGTARRTSLCA